MGSEGSMIIQQQLTADASISAKNRGRRLDLRCLFRCFEVDSNLKVDFFLKVSPLALGRQWMLATW